MWTIIINHYYSKVGYINVSKVVVDVIIQIVGNNPSSFNVTAVTVTAVTKVGNISLSDTFLMEKEWFLLNI